MKLSNKVRWILVLPAIIATFGVFVIVGITTNPGNWFPWVAFSVPILAGLIVAPLHGKRFVTIIAALFILTCLFPPWQTTNPARNPMGYGLIFSPPQKKGTDLLGEGYVVNAQIDFGRLFLEWAALAAVTGAVWFLIIKPPWLRGDKASRPQKFIPPPPNSNN